VTCAAQAKDQEDRSAESAPLRPKLVVEVCYDHFSGDRFRHGTRLLRWARTSRRSNARWIR
jgi:hypothetical protein